MNVNITIEWKNEKHTQNKKIKTMKITNREVKGENKCCRAKKNRRKSKKTKIINAKWNMKITLQKLEHTRKDYIFTEKKGETSRNLDNSATRTKRQKHNTQTHTHTQGVA